MVCRETAPLGVLRQNPVQDTEPDQVLDDLTALASQTCGTPHMRKALRVPER